MVLLSNQQFPQDSCITLNPCAFVCSMIVYPLPSLDNLLVEINVITRRGSPVDRRPSAAEAPPVGKIDPFSKMTVTFEPLMVF